MTIVLSYAICHGKWDACITMARKYPASARICAYTPGSTWKGKHTFGKNLQGLPLHEAVAVGAPLKVIKAICRAYPKALGKRDLVKERLPIHLACMRGHVDPDVVSFLSTYYVAALTEPDKWGHVPLYYALKNRATDATIQKMLQLSPNTAKAQDLKGVVPLHVACHASASKKVVALLLKLNPDASVMVTASGRDAISFCNKCNASNHLVIFDMVMACSRRVHDQFRVAREPSSRRLIV